MLGLDGAVRCLEVYRRRVLFFHENHHILYPVNVLLWFRLVNLLGLDTHGPKEFFSAAELMNCFAGAGCLAILSLLMYEVTSSMFLGLAVAIGLGFSRAFIIHATNIAEPMVGVFWGFAALGFAALWLRRRYDLWLVVSGSLFSLAMATYRSAILLSPAAIVVFWRGSLVDDHVGAPWLSKLRPVAIFTMAGLFSSVGLYGWAYSRQSVGSPMAMLRHFFENPGTHVYFGVSVGKLLNIPVGMVRNVLPILPHYNGIRGLLGSPKASLGLAFAVVIIFLGYIGYCAATVVRKWHLMDDGLQTSVLAAIVGLFFTAIPVVLWDPQYDKIWLQPLACLVFLLVLSAYLSVDTTKRSIPYRHPIPLIGAFICLSLVSNLVGAVSKHLHETSDLSELERLSQMIHKDDLIVGDWDRISTLYRNGWDYRGQLLSFPSEAVIDGHGATTHLRQAIRETRSRGGNVYFLGLLDIPKDSWDSFLGSRCGVPYSDMNEYRANAIPVSEFATGATPVVLRRLVLPPLDIDVR